MQDADDHEADLLSEEPKKKVRAESEVDLETDSSLVVDISDALSEQDKVKYTVHTKVTAVPGLACESHVTTKRAAFNVTMLKIILN